MANDVAILENCRLIDNPGLLKPYDVERLRAIVTPLLHQIRTEFILYIVNSVPSRDFRDHAVAARQQLSRNPEDSVILVLAINDRHAEIATATRHANLFTRSASSQLLQKTVVPMMRHNKPVEAMTGAVKEMCQLLIDPKHSRIGKKNRTLMAILLALAGAFAGVLIWLWVQYHACMYCRGWCHITTVVKKESTRTSAGLRELQYSCTHCGKRYTQTEIIPTQSSSSSDSGGSDSGSSGGGSDGGGGADW